MIVMVIGGGGREHALAWKINQSSLVSRVICAPGNGGTASFCENLNLAADDVPALVKAAQDHAVDFVVVGPEAPLVAGLVNALDEVGILALGPRKALAEIEGSKTYAKQIMEKAGVPTAYYGAFTELSEALAYLEQNGAPVVIKADGLAAGKGVTVALDLETAKQALKACLEENRFGGAGARVVIEEFLEGVEASFMVLTDGVTVLPLATSRDHKRRLEGDLGPNTGGMGAISPSPDMTAALEQQVIDEVVQPTLRALHEDLGEPYRGFLYVGLMLTSEGPKVLEFNARLGDPETQPLMVRLAEDWVPSLMAAAQGSLKDHGLSWHADPSATVVMVSEGYPGPYEKGAIIEGIPDANSTPNVEVFLAGAKQKGGALATSGGRVLAVTAKGPDLEEALSLAYTGVSKIHFQGARYRTDIGRS